MYNRIAIVGGPGTGKTTLSNELSKILDIEAIHIDGIHHLPNWQERDRSERVQIILDCIKKDKWIIDGTYRDTLKQRFERADLIIFLDYSSLAHAKGILQRYAKGKNKEKPEIPGCKERMTFQFFTYSLKYNKKKRHFITDELKNVNPEKVLIFKRRKDLNKWLKDVSMRGEI